MKREINLDLTSLLDVILILLFIVLTGVGHRAQDTKEDLTNARVEINELNTSVEKLNADIEGLNLKVDELTAENDQITNALELAGLQNEELLAIMDYKKGDLDAYPAVLTRVSKGTLVCTTEPDSHSERWNVNVDLYLDSSIQNDMEYADSFQLVHDYDLTPEERRKTNARQELQMTRFLSQHLDPGFDGYCYITIQYPLTDEHFSSLDLDIIERSIGNVQNDMGLKFYIERAGIY